MPTAADWIARLALLPHPEGGYFRETYRSAEAIAAAALPARFGGERSVSTAIYYLLEQGDFSAFHRIRSDEVWHLYAGSLELVLLLPDGRLQRLRLGGDPTAGEQPQAVAPQGCWFAARPLADYALCGCTVAPGFDFADFEMAERAALLAHYPAHADLVTAFTRS